LEDYVKNQRRSWIWKENTCSSYEGSLHKKKRM